MPVSFNGSYSQNFDTLANTGTNVTWTNDTTLSGWFLFSQPSPGTAITTYSAGDGISNTGNFYSYGTTGSAERALGGLGSINAYFGSPATGNIAGWIAFAATNNTGATLNGFTLSFNGEQWRNGANTTPQNMVLEYGFGSSFSAVSSWTAPGGNFDWTSPVANAFGAAVDGNVAGRVSSRGGTINTNWANGDTLWIRWVERNDLDNDHGLAIDDFSLTPFFPTVSLIATDTTAEEGNSNIGTFRITRNSSNGTLAVQLSPASGIGTDYNLSIVSGGTLNASGTVFTFNDGVSTADITFTAIDDIPAEASETFALSLVSDSAYTLDAANNTGSVTIQQNDFVVTNTNDSGEGSLRQAITNANAIAGTDTIAFNISGTGPHTIIPTSALPNITQAVIIDGYSQSGASKNTLTVGNNAQLKIVLDGTNAGASTSGLTLSSGSSSSTIQGLTINRFQNQGILIQSTNNFIVGNFIGTDTTGTIDQGNSSDGIRVSAANNTIGGNNVSDRNLISGNNGTGIFLFAGSNAIANNYIGTNASGTTKLGNTSEGIEVHSGSNTFTNNLISGNQRSGIYLAGSSTTGNQVRGNYIGTDATGTQDLGNTYDGLNISASSNIIGGSNAADRNLISGNNQFGILINDGTNNQVQGNYIGTQIDGASALGNTQSGILLFSGQNAIGGTNSGEGNIISGNDGEGVIVPTISAIGNSILGNSIFSNSRLGIDLGNTFPGNGITANDAGDSDNLQNFPVLTFAEIAGSNTACVGTFNSTANTTFRLEFFANDVLDSSGNGEGKTYLGFTNVTTDASGNANFSVTTLAAASLGNFVTATATNLATNDTSEFSNGVIIDAPTVSITSASIDQNEGNSGTTNYTFAFDLSRATTQNVIVNYSTKDGTATVTDNDYIDNDNSITFTAGGSLTQIITVQAKGDNIVENNETFTINLDSATNAIINATANQSTGTITNDDTAGIIVTQSGGTTNITEGGATDSYDIVLNSQPTADATIAITNGAQTGTSPSSLTFTSANWNVAQTVTVTATNDNLVEGNHSGTISHTVTSSDSNYNSFVISNITATITDNDSAGVTITESGGNTNVTEGGATDSYDIVLNSQPTADVTIAITNGAQTGTSPSSLTFTSANWNVAQTVTVTATNDNIVEGNHSETIAHTVTSSDSNYNAIAINSITANITDNDGAGFTINPTSLTTGENGTTANFTVQLNSQPTGDVTLNLSSSNTAEGTIDKSSLSFTSSNWNTAQTVTITGIDDNLADGDKTYQIITAAASSTDSNYNNLNPVDINVTNTDNDSPGFTITPTQLTTGENATTATFTVKLNTQPTADVILGLSSSDTAEGTIDKSSLTFTSSNWNTPQTVTITGKDDNLADGDKTYQIITAAATSTDSNYNNLNPVDINITNTDNDNLNVSITPSAIAQSEGNNGVTAYTFAVNLSNPSTVPVTVAYTTDNGSAIAFTDYIDNDGAIAFNPGETSKSITVYVIGDTIPETYETFAINLTSATNANLNPISNQSIGLIINDDAEEDCFCEQIVYPNLDERSQLLINTTDSTINGTLNNDILIGYDLNEAINGFDGDDWIFGQAGNDNLYGNNGNDTAFGGSEIDFILGNEGDDLLSGNTGNDVLNGNQGNDIVRGGQNNDFLRGGQDNDLIWGDKGDDILAGDKGNDTVFGGNGELIGGDTQGRDLLFGGSGDDILNGNQNNDTLFGEEGNDTVRGGKDDDIVVGNAGNDLLFGDFGNDSLCGEAGNDTIFGGIGNPIPVGANGQKDCICGGEGNDLLFGNEGEDKLNGEEGNDTLMGGKDNDTLTGGTDNDRLIGDLGNDILTGGIGRDIFVLLPGKNTDTIRDFEDGIDLLEIGGNLSFAQLSTIQSNNDTLINVTQTGELLAILNGVQVNLITEQDFTFVG